LVLDLTVAATADGGSTDANGDVGASVALVAVLASGMPGQLPVTLALRSSFDPPPPPPPPPAIALPTR
jgi:hypothetical protein